VNLIIAAVLYLSRHLSQCSIFPLQKLADPDYVARTVAKYKGRMFLLWRGLERTYKVKWQPPHSILDSGASSAADEF